MREARRRLAVVAADTQARDRLCQAVHALDAELVLAPELDDAGLAALNESHAQAWLVAVDPATEAAMDRLDEAAGSDAPLLLFEDVDVLLQREGWDEARWLRHIGQKLGLRSGLLPDDGRPQDDAPALDDIDATASDLTPAEADARIDGTPGASDAIAPDAIAPVSLVEDDAVELDTGALAAAAGTDIDALALELAALDADAPSALDDQAVADGEATPGGDVANGDWDGDDLADAITFEVAAPAADAAPLQLDDVVSDARASDADAGGSWQWLDPAAAEFEDSATPAFESTTATRGAATDAGGEDASAHWLDPTLAESDFDGSLDGASTMAPRDTAAPVAELEVGDPDWSMAPSPALDETDVDHGDGATTDGAREARSTGGFAELSLADPGDEAALGHDRAADAPARDVDALTARVADWSLSAADDADPGHAAAGGSAQPATAREFDLGGLSLVDVDETDAAPAVTDAAKAAAPVLTFDTSGLSLAEIDDGDRADASAVEAEPSPLPPPLPGGASFVDGSPAIHEAQGDAAATDGLSLQDHQAPAVPAAAAVDTDAVTTQVVVVRAGLGGPDAVRRLLGALPAGFGPAVVLVQELGNAVHDRLVTQLQRATDLPMVLAKVGGDLQPGHVHVLPPGLGLDAQGRFQADGQAPEQAIGEGRGTFVALSGTAPELVPDLLRHAAEGATVLAQDADSSYDGRAATALKQAGIAGTSPEQLAAQLAALGNR